MTDPAPPTDADPGAHPSQLFAHLGFGFVRGFLWLVLAACAALAAGALALGWHLEGDVSVRAEGTVRPRSRRVVKSRLDGLVDDIRVRAGDHVRAGDTLLVLAQRQVRERLARATQQLHLIAAQELELHERIEGEGRALLAEAEAHKRGLETAALHLRHVRQEQAVYSQQTRPGWRRLPLEELIPVRAATAALAQAAAQVALAETRLAAGAAGRDELLQLRLQATGAEDELRDAGRILDDTVVRAPSAGVVLTGDLEMCAGDHVRAGDVLLELATDDTWQARVRVSQLDRPKVGPGQEARLLVDAYPYVDHGTLTGTVVHVAEQAKATGGDYLVDIAVHATRLALADGMRVRAMVAVDSGRLLELAWRRLRRQMSGLQAPHLRAAG